MDEAKDLLAQLIPAAQGNKSKTKELEEKKQTIQELYQLYTDLVFSGVTPITAEELLGQTEQTKNPKDTQAVQSDQVVWIGHQHYFKAKASPQEGCARMQEKDFWTQFFQSHYFHRDRTNPRPMPGDMFTECAKEDEHEQLSRKLATFKDPLLDLTGASPVPHEGYGQSAELIDTKNNAVTQSLFRRLNHHSLMVLQTTTAGSSTTTEKEKNGKNGNVKETAPPAKKTRLREMVGYDDLAEPQARELPSLKIADPSKFSRGLIPTVPKERGSLHSKRSHTDVSLAVECNHREVEHWQPNLPGALPSDMACHVLSEMSPGGSLMSTTSETSMQHLVSSSLQAEVSYSIIHCQSS
ncbi:General transcription factor IIH subunit 1 [Desmophyllum pertusum]|uniref:General transcription factor IIH subunit 1 n=1 Tax=Desmophyllum pertusum TaxID=174260 RepID=A0A9W9YTP0_9CNID|nr:General transcription factor IIH subunit 1 [Desmophyllum pertusum]